MSAGFRWVAAVAVATGAIVFANIASAQSESSIETKLDEAVSKIQSACESDLKQYCSTVTPGEGRFLLCLEAHEDKISGKCDYALFEASRNLQRALDRIEMVADACWNDIEKHCADVEPGEGRVIQCLKKNSSSLEKTCEQAVGGVAAE